MTTQPTKEKFNKTDALYIQGDYIGCVCVDGEEIAIADVWLNVKFAKELRDWLNKVIP